MRSFVIVAALVALVALSAHAMYDSKSNVVKLTKANFQKEVVNGDGMWFIEFYAPWCGHCQQLEPAWEKAAKVLKGVVNVAAVDMTTDQELGGPYGIQGYPTLKFFGNDKSKPLDFQGGRDADSIINFAVDKTSKEIKKRQSGKASSGGSKSDSGSASGGSKKAKSGGSGNDVFVLTDSNFDETVYHSKDIWIIEFYAPWCGHCKKLQPEWDEAATALKGKAKLGKVDATVEKALGSRFKIQSYPTIKVWNYGEDKADNKAFEYPGGRDAGQIISYATQLLNDADVEPSIVELISQGAYKEECTSKGQQICVLIFLPHIIESSAEERNNYVQVLKNVAKKQRSQPFNFFWLQAGDQLDTERQLNLGFGYPAVVAIAPLKKKFSVMKAAFSEGNFNDFLTGLMIGKETLDDIRGDIKISKADAWDGKDAPPPEDDSSYSEDL